MLRAARREDVLVAQRPVAFDELSLVAAEHRKWRRLYERYRLEVFARVDEHQLCVADLEDINNLCRMLRENGYRAPDFTAKLAEAMKQDYPDFFS